MDVFLRRLNTLLSITLRWVCVFVGRLTHVEVHLECLGSFMDVVIGEGEEKWDCGGRVLRAGTYLTPLSLLVPPFIPHTRTLRARMGWVRELGYCTEWNPAMEKLAGLKREEVMGKMLTGDVFGALCRLKSSDAMTKLMIILNNAMDGNDTERFPFSFLDRQRFVPLLFLRCNPIRLPQGKLVEVLLTAQKRTDAEGAIHGRLLLPPHRLPGAAASAHGAEVPPEKVAEAKAKELAYIRQEIKNPLDGISLRGRSLSHGAHGGPEAARGDERHGNGKAKGIKTRWRRVECVWGGVLGTVGVWKQLVDYLELDTAEFMMATVMNSVVSQGMISSSRKGLQLFCDTPPEFKTMNVFGDQVRLQQVLADFLLNAVQFTPASGWVEVKVVPTPTKLPGGVTVVKLEFKRSKRLSHLFLTFPAPFSPPAYPLSPLLVPPCLPFLFQGEGLPEDLIHQMFDRADAHSKSQEGLGLSICRKIVKLMNGDVQYIREAGKSHFMVSLELPLAQREDAGSAKC
ncbi:unnamed protein product [Closterium sp. NIES-65]|nr:unnamed protein product [Closterium sp. NIES-65]